MNRNELELANLHYRSVSLTERLALQPKGDEITIEQYCIEITKVGNLISDIKSRVRKTQEI